MINQRLLASIVMTSFLFACQCDSLGVDQKRFSCSTDDDCLAGFVCLDRGSGRECVSGGAGGGASGGVAGGRGGGVAGGNAGGAGGGTAGGLAGGSSGGQSGGDGGGAAGGDSGGGVAGGDSGGSAGGSAGGAAGGSSGGQAGGSTAGGQGGGATSQVPTQLAFTTPVRDQPTSVCSAAITLEARNAAGQMVPITSSITVTLGVMQANSGISFFTSPNCSTAAVSSVVLTTGSPTQTVFVRGTNAGTFTLTASSTGLTSATQSTTMTLGPDTLAFTNAPPAGLRGGECFPLTYQSRRGATAFAVPINTSVAFGPSTVKFYADPTCSTLVTSQVMASGSSLDTVYVRVLIATPVSITATAPFDSDALTVTALPIVRRGTCFFRAQTSLDGGFDADGGALDGGFAQQLTQSCPVSPPVGNLAQAMLLVQELAAQPGEHNDVMARCRLTSQGSITCQRRQGEFGLEVRWQVIEVGPSLRVQTFPRDACASSVTLPQAVDPSKSFLLRTLNTNTGGFYDDEDGLPFFLADATTVSAPATNSCGGFDLQVVEWDGLSVTRGTLDGGLAAGVVSQSILGLPPASSNRAVLVQAALDMDLMASTCSLQVRGSMPGPSEISLRRAMGDAGCGSDLLPRVVWERLDFGTRATVREVTVPFGPGVPLVDTPITAVEPSRTFLLSSNQTTMGQGMGETDYEPFTKIAEAAFGFDLTSNGTVLSTRRGRSSGSAVVTVYVVQVE